MITLLCFIVFDFYFLAISITFVDTISFAYSLVMIYTIVPVVLTWHVVFDICQTSTALTKGSIEFARRLNLIITDACKDNPPNENMHILIAVSIR